MKFRISYIILFLFAFIFHLNAQNQYLEYEYVDGTKERESLIPNQIVYKRSLWNDVYSMTSINIDFVFDSVFARPNSPIPNRVDHRLIILFQDSKPNAIQFPRFFNSMGNTLPQDIIIDSKESTTNNRTVMTFKTIDKSLFFFHNGKQIASISGRLEYVKDKSIFPSVIDSDMRKIFFPLCHEVWTESTTGSTLKISTGSFKPLPNEMAVTRVKIINDLKRMGYVLTSSKGVFPLTYQNQDGNTIGVYETYILIRF
ncbi:MAG: hypothetical protein IKV67_10875 [Paludibacteraceae bacterium]|nr:hypothetical protein [Paludibacteraceae bacterium]